MNEQWQITNLISWKRKFKTQKIILKSNSRITLTGSWIRSRKLNQLSTWQEINVKFTFCGFSFTPMSKWRKVHETFLNTKIPFQKRTFYDHRVQDIPQVSSETSLPRLVQNKPSALIPAKKTRLNSSKHNFMVKSSRLSTKRIGAFFELFLSICVFHRRIFKLKTRDFGLENHHMMNARQPFFFVDGWHPLMCQIRFFPIPYVVDHLTFLGEGRMGDLVWVRMFFPNLWS